MARAVRVRSTLPLLTALALCAAACSGSDASPEASPAATSPVTTAQPAPEPPPTEPPVTEPSPGDSVPPATDLTAAEQIELVRQTSDDHLDIALAEYATMFDPLPGTPALPRDGSTPTSATHVLAEIEANRADLTPEQAAAFDAQMERLNSVEPIAAFLLEEPDAPAGDAEGIVRPQGFATQPAARPAPPGIQGAIQLLAADIRVALGGDAILAWVEIVPDGSLDGATALNLSLGTLHPRRAELAARGVFADCIIKLTESVVDGTALDTSSDSRPVVIHEVFHCWQFNQLDLDAVKFNEMDDWAKEGMAAYFGDSLGGLNRFNAEWWSGYVLTQVQADGTWPLYPSSYAAIGFWSRIAERSNLVAAMRRTLAAAPDNDAMYSAAISALSDGPAWLAAGALQRADWGPGWAATGPGIPSGPRIGGERSVAFTDGPVTESVGPAAHRHVRFEVQGVPASPGSVVTLALDGHAVARAEETDVVVNGDFTTTEFCIGDCTCPDGVPAFSAERVLGDPGVITASLVGLPGAGASALVEVEVFNPDEYDCENPDLGDPSGSVVGTWRAGPEAVARMFALASDFGFDAEALDVAGSNGSVLMTFAENGTGTLQYDNVTLFFNDGPLRDITISGSGTFSWGVTDNQILIAGTEFALAVNSSILGGEPLIITSDDVVQTGVTSLAVQIANNQMIVSNADGTSGEVFFPMVWIRQSE